VPATYLSSQQGARERRAVMAELAADAPTCKLLYVTPEQLVKSAELVKALQRLSQCGLLARLVIDEARLLRHCLAPSMRGALESCLKDSAKCAFLLHQPPSQVAYHGCRFLQLLERDRACSSAPASRYNRQSLSRFAGPRRTV